MSSGAPARPDPHGLPEAPGIRRFAVRTPTLPPATHTNAYVVGDTATGLAVVDPGSPWDEERAALDRYLDALALPVVAVVLTHHHADHVGGAAHLAHRAGAEVIAHPLTAERLAGQLAVDRTIEEGDRLPFGPGGLRALHTPGHAAGHLCFLDEQTGALVAGDMVASVGTIVIDPAPGEGHMRRYLESLERLRALAPRVLLPAHGEPIRDPGAHLAFYVAHRLEREARVLAALQAGAAPVPELVVRAYPDVPPSVHPLAARSLLAHLHKLREEGRAVEEAGSWRATAPA